MALYRLVQVCSPNRVEQYQSLNINHHTILIELGVHTLMIRIVWPDTSHH